MEERTRDENGRRSVRQSNQSRYHRRAQKRRRRKANLAIKVVLFVIIIAGIIGGTIFMKKYGPSKEKADLNEYYGITREDQVAVIIDNQVLRLTESADSEQTKDAGVCGIQIDGTTYLEYEVVRDYLNERFYLDFNENILLYTLPEGTISVEVGSKEYSLLKQKYPTDYVILKMEGAKAYIALEFIQQYTNIEFKVYDEPVKRAVIVSDWGETKVATVKRDTEVRYRGGVKSPVLTEVSKNDVVTIIEDVDGWQEVRTEDGFVGYMKSSCLKNERTETISRAFEEQIYQNISKDYTINMAWHVVTNNAANNYVLETIANTKGLTTISPTWFTVADTKGNINSFASKQYVNYAHQANIEVWALVRDFDGGIDSYEESYELLSHTSSRENLINQLMAEVLRTDIDGINVDFEKISAECGEHYIQFIRELSLKCHQNGIVLSVDNYVPKGYNAHYHLKEQGKIADYVIIMGYDEHYSGSLESGSVASMNFVKSGIEETLKVVPKEKTINAVPFFTRLWKEVPKTTEELEAQAGTEEGEYAMKVTSTAYGMSEAEKVIANAGAPIIVDEATGQNYAEWKDGTTIYKIWLEDEKALEAKLQLMKEYDLAGTSAWRLGFEKDGIWELICRYVN